ncbi:MAG: radical SAM protein [Promethearchaeota archaeon]
MAETTEKIRVSLGTAIILGFIRSKLDASPTTAYLMTYVPSRCRANCAFCPQSRESNADLDRLSRVVWPIYPTDDVIVGLSKAFQKKRIRRVCIQSLNFPEFYNTLVNLVKEIRKNVKIPISLSCQPINAEQMDTLKELGVERIGIPLDAATEQIFNEVKGRDVGGPYSWNRTFELLNEAVRIFGKGRVSTHIIIGLGESEKDVAQLTQRLVDSNILPGLFSFTPIKGTALENRVQPSITVYRRMQLVRYLLVTHKTRVEQMRFSPEGTLLDYGVTREELNAIIDSGEPFRTSGCPHCNRPFYNESPRGPFYNYPYKLTNEHITAVKRELKRVGE